MYHWVRPVGRVERDLPLSRAWAAGAVLTAYVCRILTLILFPTPLGLVLPGAYGIVKAL